MLSLLVALPVHANDYDQAVVAFDKGDHAVAVALFNKACSAGSGEACAYLGFIYDHGVGVGEDEKQAKRFYKLACDLGESDGCENYPPIM